MKNKLKKQSIVEFFSGKSGFTPHQNALGVSSKIGRNLSPRGVEHMPQTQVRGAGFTLVELLLYMGILSMLLIMLLQIFASIFDVQFESKGASSVTEDSLFIQNRLNYDASRTKSVIAPLLGQSSESLSLLINDAVYTYSVTGGNLNLSSTVSGALGQLNSEDTTVSATFTRLSDTGGKNHDTVTVSFTLTSKTVKRGIPSVENFKTTIGLRPKQ